MKNRYTACVSITVNTFMEDAMRYDAIFEWNMSQPEIEAYKLAVLYEKEFLKQFSEIVEGEAVKDFRRNTLPKRGDPRKSDLFRHCWKLRRETRGLLTPEQYENYVKANLLILKINKSYVAPNSICGDKAWVRWKVWERWYNQKLHEKNSVVPQPSVSTTDPKIIREIDRTKKFLFEKCDGSPTSEKIKSFLENGFFKFWIASGKVSTYYAVLSPYLAPFLKKLSEECSFDVSLFNEKVTSEVRDYFKYEFNHEFSN